jgi:hypothetical protein
MIYGGVVLKGILSITSPDLYFMKPEEEFDKYLWMGAAPNLQRLDDPTTGSIHFRSGVPVITTLKPDLVNH